MRRGLRKVEVILDEVIEAMCPGGGTRTKGIGVYPSLRNKLIDAAMECYELGIKELQPAPLFTPEERTALNIALGAFKILMEAPRPVMPQRHAEAHAIIESMLAEKMSAPSEKP